jgi:protein-L-isoaspartate(D-aspartate) O-methyltransferase
MKKTTAVILFLACLGPCLGAAEPVDTPRYRPEREMMVRSQIEARGIDDPRVLEAMRRVPRHLFVPPGLRSKAYADHPLPIGEGQTISQPYIVALMTQSLDLTPQSRVLEIGTGSGYQAAVLSHIARTVFSVEIKAGLYQKARDLLQDLAYSNVETRLGDGYYGWEAHAPYDGIMITAAVDHIPPPLLAQLKDGGRLILPLGNPFSYQNLVRVTKKQTDFISESITTVRFVPLTGKALGNKK